MTTFIDFRYSRTLATAMFTGQEQEELVLALPPGNDSYLALEVRGTPSAMPLASFATAEGVVGARLHREADGAVVLRRADGDPVLSLPAPVARDDEPLLLDLRLGPATSGLRTNGTLRESPISLFPDASSPLVLAGEDADRFRVMGRGTGRALRWGGLHYRRLQPTGLRVQIVMDWHHLRAGIPWFGTMTAEQLIAQGAFRLDFRSYAYGEAEARSTDFARLFCSGVEPDIAVHLTPPLYAVPSRDVANLGFFVVESERVQPELADRCNRMDAVAVPSRFAGDACRRAGVQRPIHVVPHGVDVEFYAPPRVREPLPGGRRFNFLAVCTHVERKNVRHLVRAFLEEFRAHEDVALFLLLRPEYHTSRNNVALDFTEWERSHERNSAPVLLSTDYVSHARLRDLYANASAYVLPSNEGFGLTLLEAMACGTPVIGLDHGGVLEFLNRDNGWLVPRGRSYVARDIDTLPYVGDRYFAPRVGRLRAAMRHVFEHEDEARRRAGAARRDCEASYTWERVSRDFARVVEETHAAGRRARSQPDPVSSSGRRAPVVAWILCMIDDEPCAGALRHLKQAKAHGARVLCLFTRYARVRDVVRARRAGFLFYRWDGTSGNALSIARSVLGPGWIGLLHPGERLAGDVEALDAFLASQPETVGRVSVECGTTGPDTRFLRLGGGDDGGGTQAPCRAVRIARTDERSAQRSV